MLNVLGMPRTRPDARRQRMQALGSSCFVAVTASHQRCAVAYVWLHAGVPRAHMAACRRAPCLLLHALMNSSLCRCSVDALACRCRFKLQDRFKVRNGLIIRIRRLRL